MPNEVEQLEAAFDATGVKFHDRPAALAEFRAGRAAIEHTDEGAFAVYDGERIPLADALLRFAYDNRSPELLDARTLPRNGAGTSRPGIGSKADYETTAQKAEFIRTHGFDAWEKLPVRGLGSSEVQSKEDWYKLPRQEKVRRLAADPNAFARLPDKAPSAPTPARRAGAYINDEAIAREKAVRPPQRPLGHHGLGKPA